MRTLLFMLGKDLHGNVGGDIAISRIIIQLALESVQVRTVSLSSEASDNEVSGFSVIKEPIRPVRLVLRSIASRHSLVHTRFSQEGLIRWLESNDFDGYVAEHSYMAESYLQLAAGERNDKPLYVNTHVPQSHTWKRTPGFNVFERGRLQRDELRVARAAKRLGCLDLSEALEYKSLGVSEPVWLKVLKPVENRVPVSSTEPQALFLGDRTWGPNQEAFRELLRMWPKIHKRVPSSKLLIAGKPGKGEQGIHIPDGVEVCGYVEDLAGLMNHSRVLIAPIRTGGGVRVKILEAIAIGLPVVSTTQGVGSLAELFDALIAEDDLEVFIDLSVRLLTDKDYANRLGMALHSRNVSLWEERIPQRSVQDWLEL